MVTLNLSSARSYRFKFPRVRIQHPPQDGGADEGQRPGQFTLTLSKRFGGDNKECKGNGRDASKEDAPGRGRHTTWRMAAGGEGG